MRHAVTLAILITIVAYLGITVSNYITTGQTAYSYIASAGLGTVIGITSHYIIRMSRDP